MREMMWMANERARSGWRRGCFIRALLLSGVALVGWAAAAQAFYADYADRRSAAIGRDAEILVGGSAKGGPRFGCRARYDDCASDGMSQTDSNWREAITLHIGREPIHLDWVASSGIDFGELGAGWVPTAMIGTPLRPSRSTGWLGMSGGQAVGPSYDWDGDSAVQRLDFEVVLPPVRGDGPRPANPVPEPTAALLFSVGMTILATVRQRRK